MTAVKTLAVGVVLGLGINTAARADSMSSTNWVFYGGGANNATPRNFRSVLTPSNAPPSVSFTPNAVVVPAPLPAPDPTPASVSVASVTAADQRSASMPVAAPTTADAYINLGTSTPPEAASLTTGGEQPWYDSPAVAKVYGGSIPNVSQQASFENLVLNDVKQTFNAAGLNPSITLNPDVHANHTLSVVSNTSFGPNPGAIGITDVGNSGFSFIDKLNYASTPEELATVVSKNVSHELMHAFGVGIHPDTTGNYIDTGTASWALLSNPDSTFSPAAIALIKQTGYGAEGQGTSGAQMIDGEQEIAAVPEPATIALWAVGGLAGMVFQTRKKKAALKAS